MAIDTHQKRASIMHLAAPWRGPHVPDGSADQGERQAALFFYSGVLWGAPSVSSPMDLYVFVARRSVSDTLGVRRSASDTVEVAGG